MDHRVHFMHLTLASIYNMYTFNFDSDLQYVARRIDLMHLALDSVHTSHVTRRIDFDFGCGSSCRHRFGGPVQVTLF